MRGRLKAGYSGNFKIMVTLSSNKMTTLTMTLISIFQGMIKSGLEEVTVFGVFFHSHLAGRAMRLRHYR